jgi:membrane-bound metal-dependent hydrolase YbcI (DUF457 family)
MPQYKTHVVVGLLVYIAAVYIALFFGPLYWQRKIELLVFTLVGALFPDIDTKSKIQRVLYCLLFVVLLVLAYTKQYYAATVIGILACLPLLVHHRSIFHSCIFLASLGGTALYMTYHYYPSYTAAMTYNVAFFLAGAVSHIGADKYLI